MTLSPQNPRIKRLRRLIRDRQARRREGVLVVDGPRAFATALDAGAAVEAVFVDDPVRPEAVRADAAGVDVFEVERRVLDGLADADGAQGLVAVVASPVIDVGTADLAGLTVVLDGLADPGNVGAVVRSAAAFGASAVVTTAGTADVAHPRAVRASAGALFTLDVAADVERPDLLVALGAAGSALVVADAGGDADLDAVAVVSGPLTVAVGSEAHGPARELVAAADLVVSLPMTPPVESLNVAVTAGIVLHALRRS